MAGEASIEALRGTVLVIDDSEVALAVVRRRLEALGLSVHTLSSARDLTRTVLERAPDLVLMDLEMPDQSGDDAAAELRATIAGAPPIVLHSSLGDAELAARAAACGAVGTISKMSDDEAFSNAFRAMYHAAVAPERRASRGLPGKPATNR